MPTTNASPRRPDDAAPIGVQPDGTTAQQFLAREPGPAPGADPDPASPAAGLRPENLIAVFELATGLHEEGHLERAGELYRQLLDAHPGLVEARHLLGLLLAQLGDHAAAADHLERAARERPTGEVRRQLGEVYGALERWKHAARQFTLALEIDPQDIEARRNLGHASYAQDDFANAVLAYRQVLQVAPHDPPTWTALGFSLLQLDHADEARRAFAVAIEQDPSDQESRHMHAALAGEVPKSAPELYVAALFDDYAHRFDRHIVDSLGYRVPEQLRALVDEARLAATDVRPMDILDLGCGTGLTGAAFADCAARCVGVDLSSEMTRRCRERAPYTEVVTGSIRPWLRAAVEADERFDLIVAGDVLNYVGDVEDVFPLIQRLLRPGGLWGFSTECAAGRNYQLQPSGRFAHSLPYLDRMAAAAGLQLEGRRPTILRVERDRPVTGHLSVLRRPN